MSETGSYYVHACDREKAWLYKAFISGVISIDEARKRLRGMDMGTTHADEQQTGWRNTPPQSYNPLVSTQVVQMETRVKELEALYQDNLKMNVTNLRTIETQKNALESSQRTIRDLDAALQLQKRMSPGTAEQLAWERGENERHRSKVTELRGVIQQVADALKAGTR